MMYLAIIVTVIEFISTGKYLYEYTKERKERG